MERKTSFPGGKAVAKYLARHAEPEAAAASGLAGEFGHAIVVPAYGEEQSLFTTLGSVTAGPRGGLLRGPLADAPAHPPRGRGPPDPAPPRRRPPEAPPPPARPRGSPPPPPP